jgi:hypothetical protein
VRWQRSRVWIGPQADEMFFVLQFGDTDPAGRVRMVYGL